MIELYYIVLGVTLIVLMLAFQAGSKWWYKYRPAPIKVGDTVRFRTSRLCYVLEVKRRAIHVMAMTPMGPYGAVWRENYEDVRLARRGSGNPTTELEARALNAYYSITCDTHDLDDCTHKGRQRIERLLPGHQR